MFGMFDRKEKRLAKYMAESLKEIEQAGGALAVCEKFGDWFADNELVKTLGICSESKSPFDKSTLMLAGINLLAEAKKVAGERFTDNRFIQESGLEVNITYAKLTFTASALLVEDEKLRKIIGAYNSEETLPIELLEPYFESKKQHEKSWQEYLESDHDFSKEAMLKRTQA